jgi:DNA gyrase subunit A
MEWFSLTQIQAQAILDMQLRRIAALERERIEEEYKELQKSIGVLEELLGDPQNILNEVKKETKKLKKDHGDDRRSELLDEEPEAVTREDLIPHQDMIITITERGYVKSMSLDTYKAQHRGGRGVSGMATRETDILQHLVVADTHDSLLFFTNTGRVYSLRCFEIPVDVSRTTRGIPLVNLLSISQGEVANAILATSKTKEQSEYILLATRKGEIKRMHFSYLAQIRSNGKLAMNLDEGDELVSVRRASENDDVVMVTEKGMAARFPVLELRQRSRLAGGVRGIKLDVEDRVVSMDIVTPGAKLFVVSRKGFGKLTDIDLYRRTRRGAKGVKTLRITDKTGPVAAAHLVIDAPEVMIITDHGIIERLSMSEIPTKGRITQGVWIMRDKGVQGMNVATITSISTDTNALPKE